MNEANNNVRGREPIIGIDLGTTNSLVAVAGWTSTSKDGTGTSGAAPRIIHDEDGRAMLPSVVRYHVHEGPQGVRAGVADIGYGAKERATEFPTTTIASVKRLMGRSLDDAGGDVPYLSFKVVEGPNRTARVFIPDEEAKPARGAVVSPQEVSAVLLRRLKEQAERSLGVEVRKAVITVPAYFDDAQRQATRDAGRLAGLEVVRIVNEPTAAALAYGIGVGAIKQASSNIIAVFDLGGGTFDVSVLRLTPRINGREARSESSSVLGLGSEADASVFQVLATAGDTHLGGDDFDHVLVKLFTDEINAAFASQPLSFPPETRRALLTLAEQTKIRLSSETQAGVEIDLGPSESGTGRRYVRTIARGEYEVLISPLVDRAMAVCRRAMRDARRAMEAGDESVATVVLVGGATRTPLVRQRVADLFGLEPYTALDPDTVVALGAAVQGAIIGGDVSNALLLDVVPLSLGVETVGGAAAKLIVRNSPVPTKASERFSTSIDGQTSIKLHIVQGEREMAADCRSLGVLHLSGIPPMPAGIPKLLVTFTLDANAVLHVTAVEERSGKVAALQVVPNYGLTREEVDRMEAESFMNAREDMTRHRVVDLVANARLDLHWIKQGMERVGASLDPAYAALLNERMQQLLALVDLAAKDWKSVDPNTLHAAKESLDRASVRLHEISIAESLKGSGT